jgi:hypothetical protein
MARNAPRDVLPFLKCRLALIQPETRLPGLGDSLVRVRFRGCHVQSISASGPCVARDGHRGGSYARLGGSVSALTSLEPAVRFFIEGVHGRF